MKKGLLIKISIVLALAAVGVIVWQAGLIEYLTDIDKLQQFILGYGALGYVIYILIYIVSCVLLLPGSILTIVAGIAFGPVVGALLALSGAVIGATCACLIGRYLARDVIVGKFGNNPIFKKIDDGVRDNGVSFLILTRLVPVFPFSLQNYAYGLTAIKIPVYTLVSLITMLPGAFIYAYMAGDIATNGISFSLLIKFVAAGIILFLVSLIPKYIAKKRGIDLSDLKK